MNYPVSRQHGKGKSGVSKTFSTLNKEYEIRKIIIVQGIEFTEADIKKRHEKIKAKRDKYKQEYEQAKAANDKKKMAQSKKYYNAYVGFCKYGRNFLIPDPDGKIMGKIPLTDRGAGCEFRYEYQAHKQLVTYRLRIVKTKQELDKWFKTPDVMLIYAGHSRYGRGTCFGDKPDPGDRWEDGTGCTVGNLSKDDGMFRLAFDFVGVTIHDIHKHGYHTRPFQGTLNIDKKTHHPDIVKAAPLRKLIIDDALDTSKIEKKNTFNASHEDWGYWKWDEDNQCIKIKPVFNLYNHFYKGTYTGPYWGYRDKYQGKWELNILLHAGWKNTAADPWELQRVEPKCKCFCHFGCSSFKHFHPIIRGDDKKNWKKTGEGPSQKNFAYFTIRPANGLLPPVWLKRIMQYPKISKGRSWEPCLEWARKKTNYDLYYKYGENFRVI